MDYCSECGVDLTTNQTMYCSPECRLRERMYEYGETEDEATNGDE